VRLHVSYQDFKLISGVARRHRRRS
jgi:hypothetical protein